MTILPDTDPLLREKSISYTKEEILNMGTRVFTSELFNTMIEHQGIGISAVQVGVLKRVICVNIDGFSEILFNPVILKRSGKQTMNEGCLSNIQKLVEVTRPTTITIKYLDSRAKVQYKELSGLAARVICHECDHLNGVLIDDYSK